MLRKSVIAATFAVLVMFVGTGCSNDEPADEPRAAGDSAADKGDAPKDEAPDGGAEAPDAGGDVDEFCEEVASQGNTNSYNAPAEDLSEADKAKWKEDMADLVDVAPAEIKPDIQLVAAGFAKVMDGEMEDDPEKVDELATSTQRMLDYMKTNCADYDIELEGPGAN